MRLGTSHMEERVAHGGRQTPHVSHTSLAGNIMVFLNEGTMTFWNKKIILEWKIT